MFKCVACYPTVNGLVIRGGGNERAAPGGFNDFSVKLHRQTIFKYMRLLFVGGGGGCGRVIVDTQNKRVVL